MDLTEFAWLAGVLESRQPLDESRPIWVRHGTIQSGPPIPHPEYHPYCEIGTHLEGEMVQFVEGGQTRRYPGDLFLAGPGVPHWAHLISYPHTFITVYFLPSVLIQYGTDRDGARLLRRFTAPQALNRRLVRPPADLVPRFVQDFKEMVAEFGNPRIGSEMRLLSLLVEMLVRLLRWEQGGLPDQAESDADVDWQAVSRAIHYLRSHFKESIYARDVAMAAGVCQSRLESIFRESLGVPWVHFLQECRIERAAALLHVPRCRVLEVAVFLGVPSIYTERLLGGIESQYSEKTARPVSACPLSGHEPWRPVRVHLPGRPEPPEHHGAPRSALREDR